MAQGGRLCLWRRICADPSFTRVAILETAVREDFCPWKFHVLGLARHHHCNSKSLQFKTVKWRGCYGFWCPKGCSKRKRRDMLSANAARRVGGTCGAKPITDKAAPTFGGKEHICTETAKTDEGMSDQQQAQNQPTRGKILLTFMRWARALCLLACSQELWSRSLSERGF